MDMPINSRIEPRVLVPWETLHNGTEIYGSMRGNPRDPDWHGEGSVWDAFRLACPPGSRVRALYKSLRATHTGAPARILRRAAAALGGAWVSAGAAFVRAPAASTTDFCATPAARTEHGHFFSDWRTLARLYPVFSPATAAGYSDIRVPSHYYYWTDRRHTYGFDAVNLVVDEVDPREVPWERKDTHIFWRGPTTGGGASPAGYAARYQRHRFVTLAGDQSNISRPLTLANPSQDGPVFLSAEAPAGALNAEIMDAAFTRPVYEENWPEGVEGMRRDLRFADGVPLGAHWAHKYVLDLDGMGYSAKFFALMESESAVIKATVFNEFWSDWAQPWYVHSVFTSRFCIY